MINKIQSRIAPIAQKASKTVENASLVIGQKVNNSDKARKLIKIYDANGFDNSFVSLMTLMVSTVIVPRFLMAKRRNPNDKEATKDEIKEVLFRDIQTCTIMLFALKMLNSLIATAAGKKTGLPMTTKEFTKVFDSNKLKSIPEALGEIMSEPKEKLTRFKDKVIELVHPTGGVKALNKSEFVSKYSGMESFDEIYKMYETVDSQGGNSDKVLKNYVLPDIIESIKSKIDKVHQDVSDGITKQEDLEKLKSTLNKLEEIKKENGIKKYFKDNGKLLGEGVNPVKSRLLDFHNNPENALVSRGSVLNGMLWWIALGIESLYLGFGIPALNQRRLEKKYLEKNPEAKKLENKKDNNSEKQKNESAKINKFSEKESRIFSKFV